MSVMNQTELDQIINELPVLPAVVQRAIEVIDSEDASQAEVADILTQDPAMATQLLGLANSPFYGLAGSVLSIQKACIILGIHTIRSALVAAGAMRAFPVNSSKFYNREALWQHALSVGGIAKFIAARLRMDEGSAFTAGLLHDIGKLALDECCADRLEGVNSYQQEHDCYDHEAEFAVLGIDHMHLGAKLGQHWNLPAVVTNTIAGHHGANLAEENTKLVALVNLSDLLCHSLQIMHQENVTVPPLIDNCLPKLGVTWDQIREWLPEIGTLMEQSKLS